MDDDARRAAWEASYSRGENFVFYPSDEVVRFMSRHIRKRIGWDRFHDVAPGAAGARLLDAGCGIGRNLLLGLDMGLEPYGADLSGTAVAMARAALAQRGCPVPEQRAVQADIRRLPWPDRYFDHAISESHLDSMSFDIARAGLLEIGRVLKPGGWFYCSLISGDESDRPADFAEDVVVRSRHEQDTVQSYYNRPRIDRLLDGVMDQVECWRIEHWEAVGDRRYGRWHLTCRRL
jgi:SAM-dependent methyltransferase